jgi:hypothetical protein
MGKYPLTSPCTGAYIRLQTQLKSVRETDAGEPGLWGVFLDKDRALPGPSPTANLVGSWKDVIAWMMAAVAVSSHGI